jgi:hypothetical protein
MKRAWTMRKHIWINQGFSSARDIAIQIKEVFPEAMLTITHKDDRPEITGLSDVAHDKEAKSPEPQEYLAYVMNYLDHCRHQNIPLSAILAVRFRRTIQRNIHLFDGRGIRVCTGSTDADWLDICENKTLFTEKLVDAGIPTPKTIEVHTGDDVAKAINTIESLGLRACIKPAVGVYGAGFWIFDKAADDFSLLSDRETLSIHPETYLRAFDARTTPEAHIVMETLPGVETSVDAVCDNGSIVSHACRTKFDSHQFISTGGEVFEIAEAVARLCKLDGLVNIQTKADADGNHKVLEVNTRAAGGFSYSGAAGIHLAADCLKMMHGEKVSHVTLPEAIRVKPVNTTIRLD